MRNRLNAMRPALPCALCLLLLQCADQVHGRVEPHPLATPGDARHADGSCQVRLARARPAHKDGVVRRLGKRERSELVDQLAIHWRDIEVEAGQDPVHREQ